ncbi:MAG: hypothetical protein JWP68_483 [Modestobacter sp.]|jgi:hypothetical protein|nr:hypothetical protein [Modestobacter sp.]
MRPPQQASAYIAARSYLENLEGPGGAPHSYGATAA